MPKKGSITKGVQKVPGMAPEGSLSEKLTMRADKGLTHIISKVKTAVGRRGENLKQQGKSLQAVEKMNIGLGDKPKVARPKATKTIKKAFGNK